MSAFHTADASPYVTAYLATISTAIEPTDFSSICATIKSAIAIAVSTTYSNSFQATISSTIAPSYFSAF